jgi:hypothetical protein
MAQIKVVSKRNLNPEIGWKDIVIDRTTALGNPYDMSKTQPREVVVAAYRKYLWSCIEKNKVDPCDFPDLDTTLVIASTFRCPPVGVVVSRLEAIAKSKDDIRLVCWCKQPDKEVACHGDVIVKCVEWMQRQNTNVLSV